MQELLAKHPDLLAGSQMNADVPRRWLLVRRELGVPGGEGEPSRFSLDHLFIDQDAIPTLVEVKRSTDTRLRPTPVYAGRSWGRCSTTRRTAPGYWPPDSLEAEFKTRCAVDGLDADSLLAEHSAGDDADAFWITVGENIRTGRLRMVFLADVIPPELQRIIEFLNEQTIRTEVLGVEVRQYVGQGHQTLVPRVVGQTIAAQETKVAPPKKSYGQLLADAAPETRTAEQLLRRWAEQHGLTVRQSPAALQFLTADGARVCQFFPRWDSVEIPIHEARAGGDDARVDAFFEKLRDVSARRQPAQKYPTLVCADLVDGWEGPSRELLDEWLVLIQTAAQPGRTPFGYG